MAKVISSGGLSPRGLGARDTLRLEAGMDLYGQEMDETINPLEANMGWTIAWLPEDRQFIGREALEKLRATGTINCWSGLVMRERVLFAGSAVQFYR